MEIQFGWDDPEKQDVMVVVVHPSFTWGEYDRASDAAFALVAQKPYPVATIVDVSQVHQLPPSNPLPHFQRINQIMPANVYASIVIGAARPVRVFMNVITNVYPHAKRVARFADTMDEARTILAKWHP